MPFVDTLLDTAKKAVNQVLNPNTAGPPKDGGSVSSSPYQGTPPIIGSADEAGPWYSGLEKVKEDLLSLFRGVAKDSARAAAGGAADAIAETDVFRKKQQQATLALLVVGTLAVVGLVVALRK